MAVKRFVCFLGEMKELTQSMLAESAWLDFNRYVGEEDYAALEAKAIKAGFAAGELLTKVKQLEAELKHMTQSRDEWRDLAKRNGGANG